MGFEVTYFYHERNEDGKGYNLESRKELKKKIGTPYEELPLEQLASVVMSQLARRDIMVVDVEIYEYTKKQLSFKESNDGSGIIIKNKKFTLDKGAALIAQDLQEDIPSGLQPHEMMARQPHERTAVALPPNEMANRASNMGRIKTWMVFDPEIPLVMEAKQRGLKYTVGKKYPVYQLQEHPMGITNGNVLTTVDDAGNQQVVSDKYFIPGVIKLVGDEDGAFSKPSASARDPKLSYQNMVEDESGVGIDGVPSMPDLRPNMGRI